MEKKTIKIDALRRKEEVRLVAGMYEGDRRAQSELYAYCSDYFWDNYRGVFFADEESAKKIFQTAFITLWEKIEQRKIYASEGYVMGKNNKPLNGSILTYFMAVARLKNLELSRDKSDCVDLESELAQHDKQQYADMLYDSEENTMLDIIADIISQMSERCREILNKFYYEEKDLDTILSEVPTIDSKDALKTKKHKCIESLRKSAKDIYNRYLNS